MKVKFLFLISWLLCIVSVCKSSIQIPEKTLRADKTLSFTFNRFYSKDTIKFVDSNRKLRRRRSEVNAPNVVDIARFVRRQTAGRNGNKNFPKFDPPCGSRNCRRKFSPNRLKWFLVLGGRVPKFLPPSAFRFETVCARLGIVLAAVLSLFSGKLKKTVEKRPIDRWIASPAPYWHTHCSATLTDLVRGGSKESHRALSAGGYYISVNQTWKIGFVATHRLPPATQLLKNDWRK